MSHENSVSSTLAYFVCFAAYVDEGEATAL